MVELKSLKDLHSRVLDLLRKFSSRGERAVFVLETKNKAVNTRYRSLDTEVGNPAPLSNTSTKKKRGTQPGPGGPSSVWKYLEQRNVKKRPN